MNNKKILVTGANGYLGVEIVKAILDMGNEVIATDVKVDNVSSFMLPSKKPISCILPITAICLHPDSTIFLINEKCFGKSLIWVSE